MQFTIRRDSASTGDGGRSAATNDRELTNFRPGPRLTITDLLRSHVFIFSRSTALKRVSTSPVLNSKIIRIEYTDVTRADRTTAWKVFSDYRRWRKFSGIYGDIRWFSGKPWRPGSRMRIEILQPVRTSVDHVITVSRPAECIAWIDHFLGDTMEQWVTFNTQPDGTTSVHTWLEVTGATSKIDGQPLSEALKRFIELWYSRFCRECDRIFEAEYAIW